MDNCAGTVNGGQEDGDGDGVGNLCDNCPIDPNTNQLDSDSNGIGDACDVVLPAESEPNDDCSRADSLNLGDTMLAQLASSEYDYFSVTLVVDGVLEITTAGDPQGDTVVGVFDSGGTQIIGCDDDNPTPNDFYSLFFCCMPAGTYCVGVKGFDADPITNYSITATSPSTCAADPDPTQNGCGIENTYGACDPF